ACPGSEYGSVRWGARRYGTDLKAESPFMTSATHIPVMLERCVEVLGPALSRSGNRRSGPVILDATLGLGGHSEAFLRRFPQARLIGLDRDPQALEAAGKRLAPFGERATLVHAVY